VRNFEPELPKCLERVHVTFGAADGDVDAAKTLDRWNEQNQLP